MQSHRLGDLGTKISGKPIGPELLVVIVDTVGCRMLAELVNHVPDVVQQASDNQTGRQPLFARKIGRLEGMRALID